MSKHYSPKNFFRRTPNRLLKKYFEKNGTLSGIDFKPLKETKIEPIYTAWLQLPDDIRNKMNQDFQEIFEMATEAGAKAIIDEAHFHGEDLAETFSKHKGFHERIFWTFLERPNYWEGATAFNHADSIPQSYWCKCKILTKKPAKVDPSTLKIFENQLSNYFHTTQGRGKNCKIDCYLRNGLDYFFAYPEDYAQSNIEWHEKELTRQSRHPIFETIFVYSKDDGTLDIYTSSDRKITSDLQIIFAQVILNTTLEIDKKDEQIYNLQPMLSRDFQFIYDSMSGIESVSIKSFVLKKFGSTDEVQLRSSGNKDGSNIYDLLDQISIGIPINQMTVA